MKYRSTYLEADGTMATSVLVADHEDDLVVMLQEANRTLIRAKPARNAGSGVGGIIPDPVLLAFTKAMAALLRAGVSVLPSIEAIRAQETDGKVQAIYAGIRERVEGGQSLAEAVAAFPRAFNRLYVELLRAGEATGALDESFSQIAEHMTWQKGIRSLIKQATIYPIVLLCAVYGLVLAMLGFTMPRLADMISKIAPSELPSSTKVLMTLSGIVSNNMGLTILGSAAAAAGLFFFARSRVGGGLVLSILVRMPVARGVVLSINRARMCRTIGMLLESGIAPIEALNMAAAVVSLPKLSTGLRQAAARLMDGDRLTVSFKKYDLLPGVHLVMLKTGEESGNLAGAFADVRATYDEQAGDAVKRAIAIMEPVMTCVLAAVVVVVAGVVLNTLYGAMRGLT